MLKAHWDGEVIDGPMVDEIREVLERGDADALKPLRDRLEILESSGEVYREDFALWWKTVGRLEIGGKVLWKRELLKEALQLAFEDGEEVEIIPMIREVADSGHPAALLWATMMGQRNGRGGSFAGMVDWSVTLEQAKELADNGDPESSLLLWQLVGRDGSESSERLVGWLENAAEAGYTYAMKELIRGHRQGRGRRGIPKDAERAAYWESRLDGAEGRTPSQGNKARWRAASANNLKQIGLSMKMYSNESRGEKYPDLSPIAGRLALNSGQIYPEYLTDPGIFISPAHPDAFKLEGAANPIDLIDDHSFWYLGYTMLDDEAGTRFVEEYARRVREGEPLEGDWKVGSKTVYALRDGIARFLITDINNPRVNSISNSKLPLMIERPNLHEGGGNVLFMDGHVEFIEYPGKFPMTRRFIEGLESLDSLGQ
ncbi:hypothetical protein JYT90_00860 [bacterium AH-315-P07]|nr:hypothetical protein [bacterium AH-315-P07]